jgi:hypothetical protein
MFGTRKARRRGGMGRAAAAWVWEFALERLHATLLLGLCGAAVALGSALSSGLAPSMAAADPAVVVPAAPIPGAGQQQYTAQPAPLDAPLALLAEARQTFQRVQDYTCTLVSHERIKGKMEPEYVIALKVRVHPFSVYMRWINPRETVGQELCYVQGRNDNKMRFHAVGLAAALGFLSIDTDDPRVFEHSRHTVIHAGLGHLIDTFTREWQQERQLGKTAVDLAEFVYNNRRCVRVEARHTERHPAFAAYRTVVYFDREHHLPIRAEVYDWPQQGGADGGELLECHSYIDIQFNVGLPDSWFNK